MISLVVAVDDDCVIGDSERDGLPWYCAIDLELFRRLTWGADVVVGRKTWESMPESVQKGRQWWVVTSDVRTGCTDAASDPRRWGGWQVAEDTMTLRSGAGHHFVIAGGATIYEQALDAGIVDRAFITRLPISSGGDVEWPGLPDGWELEREKTFNVVWRYPPDAAFVGNREPAKFEEWVPP